MITFSTSPTSSLRTRATRTSPSCSTRTPLSPILRSTPLMKPQSAKIHGAWYCSLFVDSCVAPLSQSPPTVTFRSVHIYNVEAKKRDASTKLPRRLHGYMQKHNVDFIGGDFNMSAFSTVGDVFADPEFSAPGNSFLCRLGALEEANRECTGFLIMPKRPYEWRVDSQIRPSAHFLGKTVQCLWRWGRQVRDHQPGAAVLSLIRFTAGLHEVGTSACEVDCERSTARSTGVSVRLSRSCSWKFL